ncbi:kynureninase [Westerdykella ornata]|uniref:Kynureninase n=1 Tax=Westerdykella ornata TaxID=318751 RepID=A0A6A6JCZ1_WESOR|nr:kynureninase [Westerdykella ornata]KAF2274135.1 kynureninase [Westerdykella ornata]
MTNFQNSFLQVEDAELLSEDYARQLDQQDELSKLRSEFIIPTKGDLRNKRYGFAASKSTQDGPISGESPDDSDESIYFCGNSLGLQPRRTRTYIQKYLDTWASKGVFGHFMKWDEGLPPWLHMDDATKEQTAKLVGAWPSEVVLMETLTANLHLLMASFYRPSKDRYKIIIETKAFPSDHYAAESQLALHNVPPDALITITPESSDSPYLSTAHILSVIDKHADTTALVLLPGIQYYSGQFFDIASITRHCHALGIVIGWDLAHAVGNVPLKLHDWDVDFAAWCNYKYMNGGPGVIGGTFVHQRHGKVTKASDADPQGDEGYPDSPSFPPRGNDQLVYRPRLSGWWGNDKSSRFRMDNNFVPIPGASGFQVSNPSAVDMTSVLASLDVFSLTTMEALRARSLRLTGYLEARLLRWKDSEQPPYKIITPSNPDERGAQLSVLLNPGLLDTVQAYLEDNGAVVDERKPDVLRVAPAPLYNSFWDIHRFMILFHDGCRRALKVKAERGGDEAVSVKEEGVAAPE